MTDASVNTLDRHSQTLMRSLKGVDVGIAQLCIDTMKKESIKINDGF